MWKKQLEKRSLEKKFEKRSLEKEVRKKKFEKEVWKKKFEKRSLEKEVWFFGAFRGENVHFVFPSIKTPKFLSARMASRVARMALWPARKIPDVTSSSIVRRPL